METVAITSLPAVDRPNADRWNATRSRQFTFTPFKTRKQSLVCSDQSNRGKGGEGEIWHFANGDFWERPF